MDSDSLLAKANDQVVLMTALADFASGLNASVTIDDVLLASASFFKQVAGFDQAVIIVVGPGGGLSAVRNAPGDSQRVESFLVMGDEPLLVQTLDAGKTVSGRPKDNGGLSDLVGHAGARRLYAMPLDSATGRLGVLILVANDEDGDGDVSPSMRKWTAEIAVAVDRVLNFERSRLQAITDPLTDLYNHRYFMEALRSEIRKAKRLGYALGLFMIDIDDFKKVNDTFGHLEGNEVLVNVAQAIQRAVRASDVTARYGGEEFAVILVGCAENALLELAEKVRSSVEEITIEAAKPEEKRVTVSLGAGSFDDLNMTAEQLIDAADKALLAAKAAGKNRVVRAR